MRMKTIAAACALALAMGMARKPPEKPKTKEGSMTDVSKLAAVDVSPSSWEGGHCGVGKPSTAVVLTAEDWSRLWKEAFNKEAPETDFEEHFAAGVFLGLRNTGGYSVEFLPPEEKDGAVVIGYRVIRPSSSGFVIQAFTQPYGLRLYRRTSLPVRLEERK